MRSITSIGLILCGLCAIANAELVDNFESYTLHTWPSGWTRDGNASSDPANNRVELDPVKPSNQVLKLYGNPGWAALAYYPQSFPDEFVIEASVYNGSESVGGATGIRGMFAMRTGTHWWGVTNPARELILFRGDGTILGSDSIPIGTYNTGQWYDVSIHYRRNAQDVSLRYWLDDVYLGTLTSAIWDQSVESGFDHIDLDSRCGTAYFDDIKMTVVPLPGAAILGFVGLSCAGWRLRRRAV